jgi:hypothetical protein
MFVLSFYSDIEFASCIVISRCFLGGELPPFNFLHWFKNLDFIGVRPDFASTILAAAKKEFIEQWHPANDEGEEEHAFSSALAPLIGKQFMPSKSKSLTTFL